MTIADSATIQHLLDRGMVARLATVSRSGRPHVNPNYFVGDESRLYLGTTTGTLAVHNIASHPTVRLLVEDERDHSDRRTLLITGIASVRTDESLLREYKRRDARKYFRTWPGLLMSLRHLHRLLLTSRYLSAKDPANRHCVVEIEPIRFEVLDADPRCTRL